MTTIRIYESYPTLLNSLLFLVFYTGIFSAYINTSLASLILAIGILIIYISKINLSLRELIIIPLLLIYLLISIFMADNSIVPMQNFRFWLGIFIYLYLFRLFNVQNLINIFLFRILVFFVIGEVILINIFIDPWEIYTGPGSENFLFYNFYYRPMSFAGNATLSVSILIVIFASINLNNYRTHWFDWLLITFSVILFYSTTGFILYFTFLIFKLIKLKVIKSLYIFYIFFISIFIFIITFVYINFTINLDTTVFQKIHINYLTRLFFSKLESYMSYFYQLNEITMLLGGQINSNSPATTGDHGWFIMLSTIGILGMVIYFLNLILYLSKGNNQLFSIFLLFLATFHYPVAMTAAGQIILAIMLNNKGKDDSKKIKS